MKINADVADSEKKFFDEKNNFKAPKCIIAIRLRPTLKFLINTLMRCE
jgi:hypothetical protein